MDASLLAEIDAMAAYGKIVVSADDENVIALIKDAIENDRSVAFYLTRAQANAITEWYWTPDRVREKGLQEVPGEELERIRSELGIEGITSFRFAPISCACGHDYGAFDFLQQGAREHGLDAVNAIFALKNTKLFQVNPPIVPICPECESAIASSPDDGITYESPDYGGCSCCAQQ
ncbi:hypothetical protein [Nonomuraea sp. NPDC002799]